MLVRTYNCKFTIINVMDVIKFNFLINNSENLSVSLINFIEIINKFFKKSKYIFKIVDK